MWRFNCTPYCALPFVLLLLCSFALASYAAQFSVKVDSVLINATVRDKKGSSLTELQPEDFQIFENGVPQKLNFFSRQDHPVSLAIVLDASKSMSAKAPQVRDACMAFIQTSNPEDEVFILSFNRQTYLHADFTRDHSELEEGLNNVFFWGDTALWNALLAAVEHHREGLLPRKVILAITDGENTTSASTYEKALQSLSRADLTLYFMVMGGDVHSASWKQVQELAEATGGECFLLKGPQEIQPVALELAKEIRHQYTLSYVSSLPPDGRWRPIQVRVLENKTRKDVVLEGVKKGYYSR